MQTEAVDEVDAERDRATSAAINNHSLWSEDAMNFTLYPRVCFSVRRCLCSSLYLRSQTHTKREARGDRAPDRHRLCERCAACLRPGAKSCGT